MKYDAWYPRGGTRPSLEDGLRLGGPIQDLPVASERGTAMADLSARTMSGIVPGEDIRNSCRNTSLPDKSEERSRQQEGLCTGFAAAMRLHDPRNVLRQLAIQAQ